LIENPKKGRERKRAILNGNIFSTLSLSLGNVTTISNRIARMETQAGERGPSQQ
jgi:hypothetical protein